MLIKFAKTTLAIGALTLSAACGAFQPPEMTINADQQFYQVKQFAEAVDVPWGMAQLPSGEILVTDRKGELRVIRNGKMLGDKVGGLPEIVAQGQGGLLDIALHPKYQRNGWIYITLSSPQGEGEGSNTALMRAKYDPKTITLTHQKILYKGSDNTTKRHHFGSRIAFDNDGYVYFSIGDRGERDRKPQDLSLDGGKVYRLHDDGRIPKDNPFVTQSNAKKATFSYGHRNPQGMAKHPITGDIWLHEHGPKGGDEINLVAAGKNYGWPVISYGVNYSGTKFTEITEKAGMEQPLLYWTPSIAPSGMVFITSDKYPHWQGKMLVGSLKFHHLVLVDVTETGIKAQAKLFEGIGRVRSLMQGSDGYLYVGTDGDGIKRIEPKA
ncbi:PQQ-dependent sugar dehydrogenase [Thalassotalea euphylliae]|uniref:PQQ-dependent sugar dehydrogenase n=1 Tax=Thalassotalea euphylliae TaxID=1655234 RepID=A0A3E0TVZ8_9GAMM|nr:PQQ-dependent sugar dehydrogenase [Thalassotalea euphylliae]REL28102.1 PQQ-dependent sugar dehydrogenase [Thalassotalea euphylliae]